MVEFTQTEDVVQEATQKEYEYGFVTDIDSEFAPPGLNEKIIRFISGKKNEPKWMLKWRLECFNEWKEMDEPAWAFVDYPAINYQDY